MSAFLRSSMRLARLSQRSARSFTTSQVSRKDLVQDLYVSELKACKAPPPPKDAHVGVVKSFSAPSAPSPPQAPTDLASELSAYDAAEPSLATPTSSATANIAAEDDSGAGPQEFLAFLEKDLPKPEHHH